VAEEVGGFYVSLKALVDEASFRKGISGVESLANGLKGLLIGGAALAGIAFSIKSIVESASKQGQMLITAQQVNMSASALSQWEGVLAHVGGSMDAFSGAAGRMNEEFLKMDFGGKPPSDDFFLALGQLGIDVQKLKGEDSNARMQDIMSHALSYKGPGGTDYARVLIRQLGGGMPGLESIFDYLQVSPKESFGSIWAQSGREQYTNPASTKGALEGSTALRDLQTTLGSIFTLFSSDVMKALAPALKSLNAWLTDPENKANISAMIKGMADLTAAILKWTGGTIANVLNAPNNPDYQAGGPEGWAAGSPFFQRVTALGKAISDLLVPPATVTAFQAQAAATMKEKGQFDFQEFAAKMQAGEIHIIIDNKNGSAVSVNGQPVNQSGKTATQLR
jgi:hypothetical protein